MYTSESRSTHAHPAASCDATTIALRTCVRWYIYIYIYIYHSQTWNIFPFLYKVPCCFCLRVALNISMMMLLQKEFKRGRYD